MDQNGRRKKRASRGDRGYRGSCRAAPTPTPTPSSSSSEDGRESSSRCRVRLSPSKASGSSKLLDLVLQLADVLRGIRVVQLALDAALLPLRLLRFTWISSSAMRCLISATAAMLSASRRRTAITSSLL
ncbi:hypothetical protein A6R68_06839 [Neotoma lepida]|uniref:Uncharacterized protein n=1 Tax=Neotoma lepida TaxID=56216 RepID=A0A1A6GH70_NEOLE|nr:hypothetical protein A6R68_06839 [Neotoma lepida]